MIHAKKAFTWYLISNYRKKKRADLTLVAHIDSQTGHIMCLSKCICWLFSLFNKKKNLPSEHLINSDLYQA